MADLTIRERILAAVATTLAAALPDVGVERNRRAAPEADDAPCIVLFDGAHTAEAVNAGEVAYTLELALEATIAASADDALGPALNALYGRILAALMADYTLGGLATQIRETQFDPVLAPVQESSTPLARFVLTLAIEFFTSDGDPTVA